MKKLLLLLAAAILMIQSCRHSGRYVSINGYAQGGSYTVTLNTAGLDCPVKEISRGIDSILTCIDTTLSGYNPGSMLSRYNRGERIVPSAMFEEMFARAKEVFILTEGTVDSAAAPLFDLWGFGFGHEGAALPSQESIAAAMRVSGMANFSGDLSRAAPGQKLNFNAIAQGYSSDKVAQYLRSHGVRDMLVDIGEIFCEGLSHSGRGWRIAIDTPIDGNMTPGESTSAIWSSDGSPCGIVTSGNYRKYVISEDGKKISHTIDPRTGLTTAHNLLSATILAPDACTADAIATACMVMGLDDARDFLLRKGFEGFLIYSDENGEMKSWKTKGFNAGQ